MTIVDVVIVSYNSAATLQQCIASTRAWPSAGRVVVVDNASDDCSVAIAERYADHTIAWAHNRGFGAAQNAGVSSSSAPWVLMLNPDAQVEIAGLDAGLAFAEKAPEVAMVEGAIQRLEDGAHERWCGAEPGLAALAARLLRLRERFGEQRVRRLASLLGNRDYSERLVMEPTEVEFLAAVAPIVRRSAFNSVGGFDEDIFLYAEDIDLCRRMRRQGWTLMALPVAWATHVGGASSSGRERWRARVWWESHAVFVRKHWSGPRRRIGLMIVAVGARVQGRARHD